MKPGQAALEALLAGRHDDPFSLLGPHIGPKGTFARALIPGAERAEAHDLAGNALGWIARTTLPRSIGVRAAVRFFD